MPRKNWLYVLVGRTEITARFEWKVEDLWVGAYWRLDDESTGGYAAAERPVTLDIWICLFPCIPLHVSITWWESKEDHL